MTPAYSQMQSCERVIIAGFGGQGIIFAGKLLAQIAMKAGKEITYMPAYGAEVRGGTSNCAIVVSDDPIASPVVNSPNSLLILNKASLAKFASRLAQPGLLIYNSSLIETEPRRLDRATVLGIPADELAIQLGNQRIANMVMLGAYLQAKDQFSPEDAAHALPEMLAQRYHHTIPTNTAALEKGAEFARSSMRTHAI